jgi:hypothetical protein
MSSSPGQLIVPRLGTDGHAGEELRIAQRLEDATQSRPAKSTSVSGVAGVEVRPRVRAFLPVHPDRYPIEGADPRHAETLQAAG